MRIDILSIFPEMFSGPLSTSILKRAQKHGLLEVAITDVRTHARDRHRTVDGYPHGGGPGMVMRPEPIFSAVEEILERCGCPDSRVILLSPQGEVFTQLKAEEMAELNHLVLICGHYEGIDDRVRQHLVDEELSIGDYILTGGELPAMVVTDAVSRLLPGVIGAGKDAARQDSFCNGLLEYPQYTQPRDFRGYMVPEVLLSGNHGAIERWRLKESLRRTWKQRPDLLLKRVLSIEEAELLGEIRAEDGL